MTNYWQSGGYNGGGISEPWANYDHAYYSDGAIRNGGDTYYEELIVGSGGGATSITINNLIEDGQLANYINAKDSVLIVAGGGGGCWYYIHSGSTQGIGGAGGGISGTKGHAAQGFAANSTVGTQTSGYAFGQGGIANITHDSQSGSGGGWYGGSTRETHTTGAGGSGYIGSSLLFNKSMCGYNVPTSDDENTKTISVTNHSSSPIADYAKEGNGYARITYLGK